jgi:ATP-dependent helicase HepA
MDIISRDRAAAYFADDEQGAQALICSEIGSEGRNFQFAHLLVLFDLPLNPDLLEQRIGRLDRIGQAHDIEIHIPYYQDHAQELLFRWYHEGCNAFASSNAAGGMIFAQCQEQLEQALRDLHDVESLLSRTQTIADETKRQLETGRDRLLELSSCNGPRAEALVEAIEDQEQRSPQDFMEAAFDRYGVNMEFHSEGCYVIAPGDHMFDHFPHLPDEGLTATFRRDIALQRDDIRFLTWEHPMVSSVIDLVLAQEKGSACITTIRTEGVKPGTVLLEAVYGLQAIAPRLLQVQRFLPVTTIRTLTDLEGKDIAAGVPHHRLNSLTKKLDKTVGRQIIDRLENELRDMSKHSQQLAHERARPMIEKALAHMHAEQERETNRLLSLQAKNPAIRDEEIDFLRYQTHELDKYLRESQAQLEGLRVIVAT